MDLFVNLYCGVGRLDSLDNALSFGELTPEDIGQTAETIAEAKRRWRVLHGKGFFKALQSGRRRSGPEAFDAMMAELQLTPEDIGESAQTIGEAKQNWHASP